MTMHTGLNARGKIDRESDKGDSYAQGLVSVYGAVNVRPRLPQLHSSGHTVTKGYF